MPTPSNRVPVRVARGTKANIDIAVAAGDLKEGELVYVSDENALYTIEGGVLTQASADLSTASLNEFSDVDTTSAADGTALIYQNNEWIAGPVIGGVNYSVGASGGTDYTIPTGFSVWESTFSTQPTGESANVTLSNNDFTATATASSRKDFTSQTTKNSGKLYWEVKVLNLASQTMTVGLTTEGGSASNAPGANNTGGVGWTSAGSAFNNSGGTYNGGQTSFVADDILMFAIDFSAKYYWIGKNGTWFGSGNPAGGLNPTLENWTGTPDFYFAFSADTSGQSAEIRSTYNSGTTINIPYSIDRLDDVDTSTVAPTDGQALVWDNANSKWEPGAAGATSIGELTDVDTSTVAPTDGQALVWDNANSQWEPGAAATVINDLTDVDTSTVAPTDGQALVWDNTNSQWEPGTPDPGLPAASDGEALIYENGQWVAGPVIGGVNYATGQTPTSTYTVPTGYTIVTDTWQIFPAGDPDVTLSNNDLTATVTGTGTQSVAGSTARSSGKWYWEVSIDTVSADTFVGITSTTTGTYPGNSGSGGLSVRTTGQAYNDGIATINNGGNKGSYTSGDIIMLALDLDNGEIYMGKNGTWFGTSDPATSTDSLYNNITAGSYYFTCYASVATEEYTQNTVLSAGTTTTIPYSIDNLDDVDTSTVAPADGQALVWDNTAGKWEPGTVSGGGGASLPSANDGEALIYENGQWVAGPVIGGYDYTLGDSESTVYTPPTGFSVWSVDFDTADTTTSPSSDITLSNSDRTATSTATGWKSAISDSSKSSGKWYWEIRVVQHDTGNNEFSGVWTNINANYPGETGSGGMGFRLTGVSTEWNDAGATKDYTTAAFGWTSNDILMFAIDLDNKKFWWGKNGTWDHSGDPAAGTNQMYSNWTGTPSFYFAHTLYNSGTEVDLAGYRVLGTNYSLPYGINNLDDVDTSTAAPTDGQVLTWDNANSQWEPATPTAAGLPTASDGAALIYEDGQWVAGPIIGGVNYSAALDPNVSLLLNMDGSSGGTQFTDSSQYAATVTASSVTTNTTTFKYGTASADFTASGSAQLTVPNSTALQFQNGDFTVEFWVNFTANNNWAIFEKDGCSLQGDANRWVLKDLTGNVFVRNWTPTLGQWYHVAIVNSSGTVTLYVDGSSLTTGTYTPFTPGTGDLNIGNWSGAAAGLNGYIDDFRITKGVAVYTANFTPPTSALDAAGSFVTIPYSIDKLDDVDTSTAAPTDGQVLAWDNANSKWEPGSLRTLLGIGEYADDTAAGSGGVASGALYYNTTSSDYRLKS